MQDFRSFSEGTLKKALENIKASGEDSQFYLNKELQAHFRQFKLPTIQVDLVTVSDEVRPVYGDPYPKQTISKKARDLRRFFIFFGQTAISETIITFNLKK